MSEGLRRIAIVIRWAAYLIVVGCLILTVFGAFGRGGAQYAYLLVCVVYSIPALVLAWIIDGFAKPRPRQEK